MSMKTRRYHDVSQNGKYQCTCYACVGDIIDYRDKKALAQFEDSMVEYDLTNNEKGEDDESILGVGL